MFKKVITFILAGTMIMAMYLTSYASSDDIQMHLINPEDSSAAQQDNVVDGVATFAPEPRITSSGTFNIKFNSNQKLPVYVGSDTFTITSTSCRINMNVKNLLPNEPLNDQNVYLTLYGPGCGVFGKEISFKIGGGNLGYTFTGLTKGAEYDFEVEMWDWVDISGNITNFGKVV